jgi:neutral ceramidase
MTYRIAALAVVLALGCREAAAELRAGAAKSNVTPWLGISINGGFQDQRAASVHDELHARAIALDDGTTRLAIVVVDTCVLPRSIVDDAKRRVQAAVGLEPGNVLISATHTHSAGAAAPVFQSDPDPEYQRFLAVRIADAVRQAVARLEPARVAWGARAVPEHVFNRRWRMKAGAIAPNPFGRVDLVKMNPTPGSPDLVEPAGPTDPELSVVALQSSAGRPIALLANYSLHYVGGVRRGEISADYFGMFAALVEQRLGAAASDPPFVAVMSNGTSGDVNNVNFRQPRPSRQPYEQMRHVAERIAGEALSIYEGLQFTAGVGLGTQSREIDLGVRRPAPEEVARARESLRQAGPPPLQTPEAIYARETVLLEPYAPSVKVMLQALRIGELAIAAIPAEVFAEIGLQLKSKSPFHPTFTIELANGYHGYLPTAAQHAAGGYETWRARSSHLEVDAAAKIVTVLMELLGGLKR